jgi:hypothetical protein
MRASYEDRAFGRLTRALEQAAPGDVQVLGLIGRGFEAERSLYKLYVRPTRAGRWYQAGHNLGQCAPGFDPIALQRRIERGGNAAQSLEGDASVLADVTCNPESPALVRALGLVQRRVS